MFRSDIPPFPAPDRDGSRRRARPGRSLTRRARLALAGCALVAAASAAGVAYAAGPGTVATTDAVVRSTQATYLANAGGPESAVTVTSLTLPTGNWVIHADDSAVGLNQPGDVVRCAIALASGTLDSHATTIGNAGGLPLVATVGETVGIKLTAPTTLLNTCWHDQTTGGTYYIDTDAEMSAHKAASLSVLSMP